MKLQLEHLYAYLPYGLICLVDGKEARLDAVYPDNSCCFHDLIKSEKDLQSVKPILRDLTEKNIINYFTPLSKKDADIKAFINIQHLLEKGFDSIYEMLNFNPEWWSVGTFNVIVKHKFDVFRLINSGLAVDITKVLHNER